MADTNPDLSRSENTISSTLLTSISGQKRPATNWLPAERKNNNKRVKSSWIYRHGQSVRKEGEDTIYWKCGLCNKDPYKATSTTSSEYHLEKTHAIFKQDTTTARPTSVLEQQQRAANKRADSTRSFLDLLIRWIVVCHIPFTMIENHYFRRLLLHSDSPNTNELLPKSHHTIKQAIIDEFERGKACVRDLLNTAKSDIHLSFDLWSSPNGLALNGVVAHFIDSAYKLQTILLGLKELQGEH